MALRLQWLPVRAGFLEVHVPVVLEDSPYFDGLLCSIAAVGIGVHGDRVVHRLSHGGDYLFCPPRPLILVVAGCFPNADLKGAISVRVHQSL